MNHEKYWSFRQLSRQPPVFNSITSFKNFRAHYNFKFQSIRFFLYFIPGFKTNPKLKLTLSRLISDPHASLSHSHSLTTQAHGLTSLKLTHLFESLSLTNFFFLLTLTAFKIAFASGFFSFFLFFLWSWSRSRPLCSTLCFSASSGIDSFNFDFDYLILF